jgi:hypothetical protein
LNPVEVIRTHTHGRRLSTHVFPDGGVSFGTLSFILVYGQLFAYRTATARPMVPFLMGGVQRQDTFFGLVAHN